MKRKYITLLLVPLVAACVKNAPLDGPEPGIEPVDPAIAGEVFTVGASLTADLTADPAAKSTLGTSPDYKLTWEESDVVALFAFKSDGTFLQSDALKLTGATGSTTATFTPKTFTTNDRWISSTGADADEYTFYAYYPLNEADLDEKGRVVRDNNSSTKISVSNVSANQNGTVGSYQICLAEKAATLSRGAIMGKEHPEIAFTPKTAVLRLKVKVAGSVGDDITFTSITMKGTDGGKPIAGKVKLDLQNGLDLDGAVESSSTSITATFDNATTLTSSLKELTVDFVVLPFESGDVQSYTFDIQSDKVLTVSEGAKYETTGFTGGYVYTHEIEIGGASETETELVVSVAGETGTSVAVAAAGETKIINVMSRTVKKGTTTGEKEVAWHAEYSLTGVDGSFLEIPADGEIPYFGKVEYVSDHNGDKDNAEQLTIMIGTHPDAVAGYNLSNPSNPASTAPYSTANCYLINKPGKYRIPLVYGNAYKNGSENPEAYKYDNNSKYLLSTIATAKIENADNADKVWDEGILKNVSPTIVVFAGNRFLEFETIDELKQGNAVIGVKNAAGTYLWSWHIWATPITTGYGDATVNTAAGNVTFMPVNLGWVFNNNTEIAKSEEAERSLFLKIVQENGDEKVIELKQTVAKLVLGDISDPGTAYRYAGPDANEGGYALYYQWGRKDPFSRTYTNGSYAGEDDGTTVGIMVENPGVFYKQADWTESDYVKLWNYAAADNHPATENGNGKLSNETVDVTKNTFKTIFDPCPVGYCIAPLWAYSASSFTSSGTGQTPWSGTKIVQNSAGWACSAAQAHDGIEPQNPAVFLGKVYFPACGYIPTAGGSLGGAGTYGHSWSSVADSAANGRNLNFNGSNVYPLDNNNRAYGFTVRAVRE